MTTDHLTTRLQDLTEAHNARLADRDPLAGPLPTPSTDEVRATFDDADAFGDLVGMWRRVETPEDDSRSLWGPLVQDVLSLRSASPIAPDALREMLRRWQCLRADQPAEKECGAVVRLPVADQEAAPVLLEHGFAPGTTSAIRPVRADDTRAASSAPDPEDVHVRDLRPGDRDSLLDLLTEMHESDVRWGGAYDRPDNPGLLAHYVEETCAREAGWAWVAEQDGQVIGMLGLHPAQDSAWAAPATSLDPALYLGLAAVTEQARGRGVAGALTRRALAKAAEAGAAGVLLDHTAQSPLSSTFWHRQGFRPLVTTWIRRDTPQQSTSTQGTVAGSFERPPASQDGDGHHLQDFYRHSAEWYAALVRPILGPVRAAVRELLPDPVPGGVAVEIGPGVGTLLEVVADAGAERIYAVEPSATLRVGLMTRVALDDRLAPMTTILPGTLREFVEHTPQQWGAVLMVNVIGHLDADQEEHFWTQVADRLMPGGRVIIGLQPPSEPTDLPMTDFGSTQIGEHTLGRRGGATVSGPGQVDWLVEWTLRDAQGRQLDQRSAVSPWRTTSPQDLAAAAERAGLRPAGADEEWGLYAFARD